MSAERSDHPSDLSRPRPRAMLRLSLDNPYAKLGVSPATPTADIAELIDRQRGEARKRLTAKAVQASDDADTLRIAELDAIFEQIGDDTVRARYDERHPQNLLLTVGGGAGERAWRPHARAGLIADWINEWADADAVLPTPRCFRLWAPSPAEIAARAARDRSTDGDTPAAAASPLSLDDLDRLAHGD